MIINELLYPKTLEASVAYLKGHLPESVIKHVKSLSIDELDSLHFDVGIMVRNKLGLSVGINKALLEDVGCDTADDASAFIIWSLWKELKG